MKGLIIETVVYGALLLLVFVHIILENRKGKAVVPMKLVIVCVIGLSFLIIWNLVEIILRWL